MGTGMGAGVGGVVTGGDSTVMVRVAAPPETSLATIVWRPAIATEGTVKIKLNAPALSAVVLPMETPPRVTFTIWLLAKPAPVNVNVSPGRALLRLMVRRGMEAVGVRPGMGVGVGAEVGIGVGVDRVGVGVGMGVVAATGLGLAIGTAVGVGLSVGVALGAGTGVNF